MPERPEAGDGGMGDVAATPEHELAALRSQVADLQSRLAAAEQETAAARAELARSADDLRRIEFVLAEERRANLNFRARADTAVELNELRKSLGELNELREVVREVKQLRSAVDALSDRAMADLAEVRGAVGELPSSADKLSELRRGVGELKDLVEQNIVRHGVGLRGDQISEIAKEVWWERRRRTLAYRFGKALERLAGRSRGTPPGGG